MFTKAFATAVGTKVANLASVPNFVMAGGAVEVSMDIIKDMVEFILSQGTLHEYRVILFVFVVDTLAHCALLGMGLFVGG